MTLLSACFKIFNFTYKRFIALTSKSRPMKPILLAALGFLIPLLIVIFYESRLYHLVSLSVKREVPIIRKIIFPFPSIAVIAKGDFLQRVESFNDALDYMRRQRLFSFESSNFSSDNQWELSRPNEIHVLHEWNDDFLLELGKYPQVETVILPWLGDRINWNSLNDSANLLIQEYYESTATDPLCEWIEKGLVNYGHGMINNWTCNRDIRRSMTPTSVSKLALNVKAMYKDYYLPTSFPPHFHRETPFSALHLHIIRNGIINRVGEVFSGNMKIVPYGCFPILKLDPPSNIDTLPVYKEVFIVAQPHGDEMYHRLSEVVPRIALYVDFLHRNPSIKIFCLEDKGLFLQFLQVLGVDQDRIITNWTRAEIVYLPKSSMCCLLSFTEPQVLSLLFRNYIKRNAPPEGIKRDKVIVIRRSHYRRFTEQQRIEDLVESAAKDFNLSFAVFKDNPPPSLIDTMYMFNAAVMVVGPHGAGISNVVFSEPGTYILEGVCNLPHANLFFQRTSLVFGHRWHGIPAKDGCVGGVFGLVGLDPAILNSVLRDYLRQLFSMPTNH